MVATDLDGTLLNNQRKVSELDYSVLQQLGENKICRVAATGRSPFSAAKVLPTDFPIDYLLFSNGAGVINWKSKQLIVSHFLRKDLVEEIATLLIENQADFMIQDLVPENHLYLYHHSGNENQDFFTRNKIYKDYSKPLKNVDYYGDASQFVVIINGGVERFNEIQSKVYQLTDEIQVIRATSPIDNQTIWLEIFPKAVSKGKTLAWLCNEVGCKQSETLSVGNDYNDLPMLNFTRHSYLVSNAPEELKTQFKVTESNENSGFAMIFKTL